MEFGVIVRTAFRIAWEKKTLWLLGIFATGSTMSSMWDIFDRGGDEFGIEQFGIGSDFSSIGDFFTQNSWLIAALGALLVLMILTYFVLHLICAPALIDAVKRNATGQTYRLRDSLSVGVQYMWRYLGLSILAAMIGFAIIGVLVVVVIVSFIVHNAIGVLSLLFIIPLGFVLIVGMISIFWLAERAIVIDDYPILDSIDRSYGLFMANKANCLICFLIYLGLSIVIALASFILLAILAIPFAIVAFTSSAGLIISLLIGIPLFLAISLPISGFVGASLEGIYTLFYMRIVALENEHPGEIANDPAPGVV